MNSNDDDPNTDALDANLAKLICRDNLPPAPSAPEKAAMLETLRKQQAAQPSGPARTRKVIRLPHLAGGLAAAALVTLAALLFLPWPGDKPTVVGSPPELESPVVPVPEAPDDPPAAPPVVKARAYEDLPETRRIELRDGSTVIAEAGTSFTEVAPRRLELTSGSLYVLVDKQEEPLEVTTARGKALALGTRFLVTSGEEDTRVAVAQGSVRLIRAEDEEQNLDLSRGEEGVFTGESLVRRPAPRLSHLVNWAREALRDPAPDEDEGDRPAGLIAVDPNGQESRLTLRRYTLDVFIENGVARTTIDQTFFNHYNGNTEGTFYFPLPPGAAVSRLAMYVFGVRNEGGMVERHRGQEIYNEIKYANRDPALLEQLEGNLYKLRIFPLEGRQEKRIFLSFTQNVDELYRTLRYWFPMDHTHENAGRIRINVRIRHGEELYEAKSSTHQFQQKVEDGDLVLTYETDNRKPDQDVLLKLLPKFEGPVAETATLAREGRKFLHCRIRPTLAGKVDAKPRQWFILSDGSASRSPADRAAQAHIVERLLAEADDRDEVAIATLDIEATRLTGGLVPIRGEAARDAAASLGKSTRVGGTNLGAGFASLRGWIESTGAPNPHLVYLGDGLATDGMTTTTELTALLDKDVPFLGIAVGKKADLTFLRSAADATGGGAFLMNPGEDLNWRVFDLLASLNTPRLTHLQLEFPGKPEGLQAYGDRTTLAAGEALTVVASTSGDLPATLTVRGKLDGEDWTTTVALAPARENAGFIPRFWAQRHLEELLKEGETHREEIVRLSQHHYVATPFTSLIVLENDKMYQDFKVEKGRKDHWAPYPAPDKIEVVREPLPWIARGWWPQPQQGQPARPIKSDPQTPEEILDTILRSPLRPSRPVPLARPTAITSPATPDAIRRHLYTAEGYFNLGLYDQAMLEYQKVLRVDRFNRAARRGMETVHGRRADFYRTAYDETRARLLASVDAAWELAIPGAGFGDGGGGGLPSRIEFERDATGFYPISNSSDSILTDFVPANMWWAGDFNGRATVWGLDTGTNISSSALNRDFVSNSAWRFSTLGPMPVSSAGGFAGFSPDGSSIRRFDIDMDGLVPAQQFGRSFRTTAGLSSLYDGYFGYYRPELVLVPLLGNLTTSIPGLATTVDDRASAVEMKLGREKRGRITEEAAALVRAAAARLRPVRIKGTITTPDGRLKGSHTTNLFLKEERVSDGRTLHHIYRELGFATRRPVTPSNLARIQGTVPHWPPSLQEMESRWDVALAEEHADWFELTLVDPDDRERVHHLKISRDGHLLATRHLVGDEVFGSLRFHYQGASVSIENSTGERTRYEAVAVDVAEALFDPALGDLVVLDLPIRHPDYYEQQLAALAEGEAERRKRILRHLVIARLWAGDPPPRPPARVPFEPTDGKKPGDPPRPLSAQAAWSQLIQLGGGTTPPFDHRTLSAALDISTSVAGQSPFLDHFQAVSTLGLSSPSAEQIEAFVKAWPDSPSLLALVERSQDHRSWIHLLDLPAHRGAAIAAISVVAALQEWPDQAELATRIADLLIAEAGQGHPVLLPDPVASFLGQGAEDDANWKRLSEAYLALQARLDELSPKEVAALLDVALRDKDPLLEKLCHDHLLEGMRQRNEPLEYVLLADLFVARDRRGEAVGLYRQALGKIERPSVRLLQKAAGAASTFDEIQSIAWQRQALKRLGEDSAAADRSSLASHYAQLIERSLAAGDATTAEAVALEGYDLLNDQHTLISAIASHHHQEGEDTEAWRWLTTILDRHPKDANASGAIADWFAEHNQFEKAAARYADAHRFDSAHPQWLVKQARVLYRAGKFDEADGLYRQLVTTEWAHQLKRQVPAEMRIPLANPVREVAFATGEPEGDWKEPGFDDQAWTRRSGVFPAAQSEDEFWETPFVTRLTFEVARIPRVVKLTGSHHNCRCEVYLNGHLVQDFVHETKDATGKARGLRLALIGEGKSALRTGRNVLAIRYSRKGENPRASIGLEQVFSKSDLKFD